MSYENSAGIDVSNHYGPRSSGGTVGVVRTDGVMNEFVKDMDVAGPIVTFPVPKTGAASYYVTEVDVSRVTGHDPGTDAQTIGGVDVKSATPEAPVEIAPGNTGVIVIADATGGTLLVKYKKYPPL